MASEKASKMDSKVASKMASEKASKMDSKETSKIAILYIII